MKKYFKVEELDSGDFKVHTNSKKFILVDNKSIEKIFFDKEKNTRL
jgi:hypothetical protein